MIKYHRAPDIEAKAREIVKALEFGHIDMNRMVFIRSHGSASRRTIARCHAMPRIMQTALNIPAYYIIEVITEKFDKMPSEDQVRTIIHELMHVPKSFGGGFKYHSYVSRERIEHMYQKLLAKTSNFVNH
jgi:predicted metallopeptidase